MCEGWELGSENMSAYDAHEGGASDVYLGSSSVLQTPAASEMPSELGYVPREKVLMSALMSDTA